MATANRQLQSQLLIDGMSVQVVRKQIRHCYIRLKRPHGEINVSAPWRMSDQEIRRAVLARRDWIAQKRAEFAARPQPLKSFFITGETIFLKGQAYHLEVMEKPGRSRIFEDSGKLIMHVPAGTAREERGALLGRWYRRQLKAVIPPLLEFWEPRIGVKTADWGIRRMKTRWGTCNIIARRIWLNLELIKKPPECLEYVLVHELVHLHERRHNERFYNLLDRFLPEWRQARKKLELF